MFFFQLFRFRFFFGRFRLSISKIFTFDLAMPSREKWSPFFLANFSIFFFYCFSQNFVRQNPELSLFTRVYRPKRIRRRADGIGDCFSSAFFGFYNRQWFQMFDGRKWSNGMIFNLWKLMFLMQYRCFLVTFFTQICCCTYVVLCNLCLRIFRGIFKKKYFPKHIISPV